MGSDSSVGIAKIKGEDATPVRVVISANDNAVVLSEGSSTDAVESGDNDELICDTA